LLATEKGKRKKEEGCRSSELKRGFQPGIKRGRSEIVFSRITNQLIGMQPWGFGGGAVAGQARLACSLLASLPVLEAGLIGLSAHHMPQLTNVSHWGRPLPPQSPSSVPHSHTNFVIGIDPMSMYLLFCLQLVMVIGPVTMSK
jgi:hypothetical protein